MNVDFLPAARTCLFVVSTLTAGLAAAEPAIVRVMPLAVAPVLDGAPEDWREVEATRVELMGLDAAGRPVSSELLIKAGSHRGEVYLLLSWADADPAVAANPWSLQALKTGGDQRRAAEDRVAIKFDVEGYAANWLSGWELAADTWHWKASRSHPRGVVHDKSTVVTREVVEVAAAGGAGSETRRLDPPAGTAKRVNWSSIREDLVSEYELGDRVAGSLTDISSRAVWADGAWHLELKRALDTGHADDLAFVRGHSYQASIAVTSAAVPGAGPVGDQPALSGPIVFQFHWAD